MNKRQFLRGSATAAVLSVLPFRLLAQQRPVPPRKRLNLLFITADDLDESIPGYISGVKGLTPNLDALAARSHRFLRNRTVAPICMPSREAFMSGLLPHHSGGTGFIAMNEGTPTLTTVLQAEGYYTAAIHKVDHMLPQSSFPWDYIQQSKVRSTRVHAEGLTTAIAEAKGTSKPFFVQCNINDPHRPFYGSVQAAKVDHDDQGPFKIEREVQPAEVIVPPMLDDLPEIRTELAQYWNSAQRLDLAVGEILKALDRSGEAENTAIIFCNDHGMPFPFAKATCYDYGTRQPFLLSWPGMAAPRAYETLTSSVDLLPTLLELLGAPLPEKLDGRSLLPLILGKTVEQPEFQFTYVNQVSSGMAYPMRAIQDRRYALLFSPWSDGKLAFRNESMSGLTFPAMKKAAETDPAMAARVHQLVEGIPLAFYDVQADPGQRHNVIAQPRFKARVERMKLRLLQEMQRTGDPELANYQVTLSGGQAVVPQDPAKYRLKNGGDG